MPMRNVMLNQLRHLNVARIYEKGTAGMSDTDVQAWMVDPSKPAGIAGPVIGSLHYSAGAAEWQPTTEKGFWIKPLFEDVSSGTKTLLMKVDPGAWSPRHNHPGELEQIYVLSGTFYDQEGPLKAGTSAVVRRRQHMRWAH